MRASAKSVRTFLKVFEAHALLQVVEESSPGGQGSLGSWLEEGRS